MFCNSMFGVLSSYEAIIKYLVARDQRKYSRQHGSDATHYVIRGYGVPFINYNKVVTKHYKSATFTFAYVSITTFPLTKCTHSYSCDCYL